MNKRIIFPSTISTADPDDRSSTTLRGHLPPNITRQKRGLRGTPCAPRKATSTQLHSADWSGNRPDVGPRASAKQSWQSIAAIGGRDRSSTIAIVGGTCVRDVPGNWSISRFAGNIVRRPQYLLRLGSCHWTFEFRGRF